MEPKPTILTNLCLIRRGGEILLAMKKRGFGVGKWNGYGGKVAPGETMEQSLEREIKEESGLSITNYKKVGVLRFDNFDRIIDMEIFEVWDYSGELVETEEMSPKWFSLENIPFSDMWGPDRIWYPLFLGGKLFKGEVVFDKDFNIMSSDIQEVTEL
jgi:ADP-ribose pyrophosphatase YjhB (NUDIX family)